MLELLGSLVVVLGLAQPVVASEPEVTLTAVTTDEQLSRRQQYVITWRSAGIPPASALSLRLSWTAADSGLRLSGVPQATEERRLITTLLDAQAMRSFMAGMQPQTAYPTIESGRYVWDLEKFCRQNTQNGHSVCASGVKYHVEVVIRAANDPCGDNLRCDKPRGLFRTFLSRGTISFVD